MRAVAGLLLLLCAPSCGGAASESQLPPRRLALSLPALDGGTVSLREQRGRVVVLHLFTTWDAATTADVGALRTLYRNRADEVAVIGVALDVDGRLLVDPWRRELEVPYPIALATEAIRTGQSPLGRIRHVPTTIVLSPRGTLVARIERPLRPGELDQLARDAASR